MPDNAPREYQDPNVLWNAVEMVEKNKNAQLCRMMKASLPNNWSYEIAKETVRQYVKDNFVSKVDYTSVMIENYKKAAVTKVAEVKNEIVELIDRVVKRHNFLKLPLVSGVFLAKVSNRQMLQDPNNMISFLEKNDMKASYYSGH